MKQRNLTLAVTASGMLLVLLAAYGLDRWVGQARAEAAASFRMAPAVRTAVLANLVLALLWLMLAWFAWVTRRHSRLPAFLYLLIGTVILALPVTAVGGQLPVSLFSLTGPASSVGMTGALLTAIGIGLLSAIVFKDKS